MLYLQKKTHMRNYLIILFIIFNFNSLFSQVGIGTASPHASSALHIESSNSGLLLPRLTTVLRDAISNPATGLLIYNLNTNSFQYNIGTSIVPNWVSITGTQLSQSSTYNVGTTAKGWNYYNVTFATPFTEVPSIQITFREGVGVDNTGSYTVSQIKVANASTTGFTIAIYESSNRTEDVFIDWIAASKTQ